MTNRVDYDVAMEVLSHEAIVRQAYRDSVGVLTWNVGMTNATGHRVERYIGNPASLQHCMNLYVWALERYAQQVRNAFAGVTLTKAQFAAALSFHWNTGAIARAAWVRNFKTGNIAAARKAFMDWRRPPEIVARRTKERDLFFDGKWSHNGTAVEYTRVTSSLTPVWGSAQRINVERELRSAFGDRNVVTVDQPPQPENVPPAPTLSPEGRDDPVVEAPVPQPMPDAEAERGGVHVRVALIVAAAMAAVAAFAFLPIFPR